MESNKHTPAPWRVRFFNEQEDPTFFVEANNNNKPELGYGIEIMGDDFGDHNGYPREQRLADANLISAAPELLAVLKLVRTCSNYDQAKELYGNDGHWTSRVDDAINKATNGK